MKTFHIYLDNRPSDTICGTNRYTHKGTVQATNWSAAKAIYTNMGYNYKEIVACENELPSIVLTD